VNRAGTKPVRALSMMLCALCSLIGGCSSAQIEAAKIAKTAHEEMDTFKACIAPIEVNPQYARVYEKFGMATTADPRRDPSEAQLADTQTISDSDIAVVLNWYGEGQQCVLPAVEAMIKVAPEFQIYFVNAQSEITDFIHEIVTTKTSYGHVNHRILALHVRQRAAGQQMAQTVRARLLAEHQQELQEAQAAAEAVAGLAVDALLILATRQANLVHARQVFVAAHPTYRVSTIRAVTCNPDIKSVAGRAFASAKAEIMSNYAARGMNTDPLQNSALAAELAVANDRALIASVSAACAF
jgi:hypothetical protein